eukprot:jgi/Tetstr1/426878/TSEL_017091.t1
MAGTAPPNPYWLQALAADADAVTALLAASGEESGGPREARLLRRAAAALAEGAGQRLPGRDAEAWAQAACLCGVLAAGARHDWAALLAVVPPGGAARPGDGPARQRYRVLARVVHPDKCAWPRAADAFRLLGEALAAEAPGGQTAEAGGDWSEEEEESRDGGGWRGRKRGRGDSGEEGSPEEDVFREMPLEGLRALVGEMQRGLMCAMRANAGREAMQLHSRLRVARAVLSERIPSAAAADEMDRGGGFLH